MLTYQTVAELSYPRLLSEPGLESETVFGFVRCQGVSLCCWCGLRAVSLGSCAEARLM